MYQATHTTLSGEKVMVFGEHPTKNGVCLLVNKEGTISDAPRHTLTEIRETITYSVFERDCGSFMCFTTKETVDMWPQEIYFIIKTKIFGDKSIQISLVKTVTE